MLSLNSGSEPRIYTDYLKSLVVRLPNEAGLRFRGMHMQDAHEFLAVLLNALHNELNLAPPKTAATSATTAAAAATATAAAANKGASEESKQAPPPVPPPFDPAAAARAHWREFEQSNTDLFSRLFYCQSAQYVICSTCRHASCNHHVQGQLTLDIPHMPLADRAAQRSFFSRPASSMPSAPVTLAQCLATQLVADHLEDYFCGRCQKKNAATTSMYFTSLPPLLLIQLKRFDVIAQMQLAAGSAHKDETPCSYPLEIDLSMLLQPHHSIADLATKPYRLDPRRSSVHYRLVGLVRHHDDHYTAFTQVRDPRGKKAWGYFNDSKTYIESEEDMLAHEETVYLLMYQRIDRI